MFILSARYNYTEKSREILENAKLLEFIGEATCATFSFLSAHLCASKHADGFLEDHPRWNIWISVLAFFTVLNIFNLLNILLLSLQIKVCPFMYKMEHFTSATPGIFTWS